MPINENAFVDFVAGEESFVVGEHNFADLEIRPTNIERFFYFYDKRRNRLIKYFVLDARNRIDYLCRVNLIQSGDSFSPRLSFSVRNRRREIQEVPVPGDDASPVARARVSMEECYENFWKLISFLTSLREIDVPGEGFSLVGQDEQEIVRALQGRDAESLRSIIRRIGETDDVVLTTEDVNALLKRREKLAEFEAALDEQAGDEGWWQEFFEQNKWIFGYGLNYQIIHPEIDQPHYGGTTVEGDGGQQGDYLAATQGDLRFTVLVEIKKPATPLLRGTQEIRNGAWSLAKDLTDALSQIEANIQSWERSSIRPENTDLLQERALHTVQPKGIIVIGRTEEFGTNRNKRETFQRFRESIHGVDVLTFDELLARARFIVNTQDDENGDHAEGENNE